MPPCIYPVFSHTHVHHKQIRTYHRQTTNDQIACQLSLYVGIFYLKEARIDMDIGYCSSVMSMLLPIFATQVHSDERTCQLKTVTMVFDPDVSRQHETLDSVYDWKLVLE